MYTISEGCLYCFCFSLFVFLHLQNSALIYTLHSSCKKIGDKTITFPIYYLSYLCVKFLTESNFSEERLILDHILRSHLWWDEVTVGTLQHPQSWSRKKWIPVLHLFFFFFFIQFKTPVHRIVLPTFSISLPTSVIQKLHIQMLRDLLGDPKYN